MLGKIRFRTIRDHDLRGRSQSPRTVCAAFFVTACALTIPASSAQAQPPKINATGGKVQTIEHNGLNEPQVFPEVKWIIIDPQGRHGAIVEMSCNCFANTRDSSDRVNTRLDIRILKTNDRPDWQVVVPSDETQAGSGHDTARTYAVSGGRGNGQLGIVVTFVNNDFSKLTFGEYETTLVGTITED